MYWYREREWKGRLGEWERERERERERESERKTERKKEGKTERKKERERERERESQWERARERERERETREIWQRMKERKRARREYGGEIEGGKRERERERENGGNVFFMIYVFFVFCLLQSCRCSPWWVCLPLHHSGSHEVLTLSWLNGVRQARSAHQRHQQTWVVHPICSQFRRVVSTKVYRIGTTTTTQSIGKNTNIGMRHCVTLGYLGDKWNCQYITAPARPLPSAESQGSDHGGSHGWHAVWTPVLNVVQSCTFTTNGSGRICLSQFLEMYCGNSSRRTWHVSKPKLRCSMHHTYHETACCWYTRRFRAPRKKSSRLPKLATGPSAGNPGPHRRSLAQESTWANLALNWAQHLNPIWAQHEPSWTRVGASSG